MSSFRAFQIIQEDGKVQGRLADVDLADLGEGEVVVQVAYSGVNYKDALAATGAAKVVRRFSARRRDRPGWDGRLKRRSTVQRR